MSTDFRPSNLSSLAQFLPNAHRRLEGLRPNIAREVISRAGAPRSSTVSEPEFKIQLVRTGRSSKVQRNLTLVAAFPQRRMLVPTEADKAWAVFLIRRRPSSRND
ncbi:hypothetical protein CVT26_009494 [Gymnopilus dilepis]|uniref:Uncharacterized protein n=1 Tax=Gymnopilus dilepis TaxID=231916 RepID=A0A409VJZ7_9AGAR|nr:hypothetical protein CVT26_009494 [Gymnopilus dilepis]